MVQKAYEFRLYPTDEQKLQIGKTIGSSRYVYNCFLAQRKELYATEKLSLTYNQCSFILTGMKQENETRWLKEADKFALQNSLKDLGKAYTNFFEGRAKFPCFKKKHGKLAKLQRALSRTKKGSKNRIKARIKVARQHERITNQRKDFLHKYSHKVVNENQVIVLEGLRVKNMIKNRRLSKSIQDAGWSRFRGFVEYKARWYGRTYVEIDTFFPSSKLCSVCGTKNRMLTLDIRFWQCPTCQTVHDRDENASQNILNEGLRLLSEAV